MLRRNKGSILIMSVIVFSIISIICVTCCGLILSNNRIYKVEEYNEVLKQGNLGMIEIVKSNILEEVSNALSITKDEDEFYNYLTQNSSQDFINKINDISESNIKNGQVTVTFNSKESNKEFIKYKISTKYKISNHDKYIRISVKIRNPWYGQDDNDIENNDLSMDSDLMNDSGEVVEVTESENEIDEMNKINKEEETKIDTKINESDLVIFYNYEEA